MNHHVKKERKEEEAYYFSVSSVFSYTPTTYTCACHCNLFMSVMGCTNMFTSIEILRAPVMLHWDVTMRACLCVSDGAAEQSGLQCGDELLQVQEVSLQDMTRFEAWNMIKALPQGLIRLVVKRRQGGTE